MTAPGASPSPRILVVEDEADIRCGLERLLGRLGGSVRSAADGVEALRLFEMEPADIVVTDLKMPRMSGSELLTELRSRSPQAQVVILTGYGTIQTAVACLRAGAAHFLTKPFDNEEVLQIVERLANQGRAERSRAKTGGRPIVADDAAMGRVLDLAGRAAKRPVPVLIEGESGVGKEVVARFIHEGSLVAASPFLAVNAAALPDTLLESELFGYRRGAFTGADRDKDGLFVGARGGTVFLDEVSAMSPSFQAKLLRVLQERVVRPLGGAKDVPVTFRLIVATNRDLEAMTRRGEFREDLFYRLSVIRVLIPPLRDRPGDLEPLARHFLARAAADCLPEGTPTPVLSAAALEALRGHRWPGNVRELENVLKRAVVVCTGGTILPHHLGLAHATWEERAAAPDELSYDAGKQQAIERFQREYIQRALERTGGNVSHAAERCGLSRAALQRIMRQLGIDRESF
jgi:DNA-binding NtrC family response regulator